MVSAYKYALSGAAALAVALAAPVIAKADEGGVSFWIPGFFGSLAAAPQQPGWSLTSIAYQTSVSAGADVAIARERTLGNIPVNLNLSANPIANLSARADLGLFALTYVLPTSVLGGQASFALLGAYGRGDAACEFFTKRRGPLHIYAQIASAG